MEPIISRRIYNSTNWSNKNNEESKYVILPYIPEINTKIANIFKPLLRKQKTTKWMFYKNETNKLNTANVVYKVDCLNCTHIYQTVQYTFFKFYIKIIQNTD